MKNKLLHFIGVKTFDHMQRLSIATYTTTMNEKNFNFDKYFEASYSEIINESLVHLKIKDIENYKSVYEKYLREVFVFSKENGVLFMKIDISNRKMLFNYWVKNKKLFLQEIVDVYKTEN